VLRRALCVLSTALCASCATPKTISMACDNPSNPKDSPSFVIDNVNGRVNGATRMWTFNEQAIEWQDELGYTYSLDRESGQMHRVYPRFNMGYMFDCHATGKTY
jgi:hypothetical protein